ncbi:MAG: hypothetical protein ABFD70_06020 [Syntrophaceae bacterium]|nr:hypothetical protein [Deltaproteobacteria bacterium]
MKQRFSLIVTLMVLMLVCLPAGVAGASEENDADIQKYFVLHDGSKGEPYTLFYPVELTGPGEIGVYAKVWDLDPDPKNRNYEPLRIILVDSRAFKEMKPSQWKQWVIKANKFNAVEWVAGDEIRSFVKGMSHLFGKKDKPPKYFHGQIACGREGKGESIKHAVDAPELKITGGRYVVILRNVADLKATGSLLIRYPGELSELDPEVEKNFEAKPDLVVEKLSVNTRGQVAVQVANRGKGALRPIKWQLTGPEAVTLTLEAGGRNYGVTLSALDPKMELRKPGAAVTYLFENLILKEPTRVTAVIDAADKAVEENERNNRLSRELTPGQARYKREPKEEAANGLPDLKVSSVRLDGKRRVIIEVTNQGQAGLDTALWSAGGKGPELELKMEGRGWSRVQLGMLDPRKNLSRPGGVAVYDTGYVLKQTVTIDATIDTAGVVEEADEGNNSFTATVKPQ